MYNSLPHLLMPIARNQQETGLVIDRLIAEMERRAALFSPYAKKSLCNNIDRYAELSGQRLPRVVAIFDELADVIIPGSELESDLIRLAKLGLAYGIHLICATQRPY
ncbi:FtsK/SpoIIIE domain-containing protein, partial [Arthrospira platensis SPKY2]